MSMLEQFSNYMRNSDNILVDMAQKSVKQRLAMSLLYLHDNFGTDDEGMLNLVLSREDFANIVGTATESAIRVLSEFKKLDYISTKGKQIKLVDIEALKRVE